MPNQDLIRDVLVAVALGPASYVAMDLLRQFNAQLDRRGKTTKRIVLVSLNAVLAVLVAYLPTFSIPGSVGELTPQAIQTAVGAYLAHRMKKRTKVAATPTPAFPKSLTDE